MSSASVRRIVALTLLEANIGQPVHRREFADADHLLIWAPLSTMSGSGACTEAPDRDECNVDAMRAAREYLLTGGGKR